MPGWSSSTRRDRLPPDWQNRRRRVLRRDRYKCQHRNPGSRVICGEVATEVDHIEHGDNHSDENLQALCTAHHAAKSSREGGQARAAKRRQINQKFRRTEEHPGLL